MPPQPRTRMGRLLPVCCDVRLSRQDAGARPLPRRPRARVLLAQWTGAKVLGGVCASVPSVSCLAALGGPSPCPRLASGCASVAPHYPCHQYPWGLPSRPRGGAACPRATQHFLAWLCCGSPAPSGSLSPFLGARGPPLPWGRGQPCASSSAPAPDPRQQGVRPPDRTFLAGDSRSSVLLCGTSPRLFTLSPSVPARVSGAVCHLAPVLRQTVPNIRYKSAENLTVCQ